MEVLLLFLIVFLGTSILFRMPVGFSIGLGGVVTFLVYGFSNTAMAQSAFYGTNNFSLLAIPFFLFAGAVMEYSGISRSIFSFVDSFGPVPGQYWYSSHFCLCRVRCPDWFHPGHDCLHQQDCLPRNGQAGI